MMSRIANAVRGRSADELFRLAVKNLVYPLYLLSPSWYRAQAADGAFDREWGTETSGRRNVSSFKVDPTLARHGGRYQASDADMLLSILDGLDIRYPDYTFIDYGSGKGRIVLTASLRPFREVIGIEFSSELVDIADRNLEIFSQRASNMAPAKTVTGDAGAFEPPVGNLICYLYNPFDHEIMSRVIERILKAVEASDREVRVIYVEPVCRDLFEKSGKWAIEDRGHVLLFTLKHQS